MQFSQHMNRYFLLIAILQLFPTLTPVSPATTWGPLIVIFAVTMIKEAFDDIGRRRADAKANARLVWVSRDSAPFEQMPASDIRVGDLVRVRDGEEVPADLLLLRAVGLDEDEEVLNSNPVLSLGSPSSPPSMNSPREEFTRSPTPCYILTANIDGETNLKERVPVKETGFMSEAQLRTMAARIECAQPNANIYNFDSVMYVPSTGASGGTIRVPVSADQLIPQATQIKHTKLVIGAVVYTGGETKVGKNKSLPRQKWTKVDGRINTVTVAVFTFQLILVVILGIIGGVKNHKDFMTDGAWYLRYANAKPVEFIILPLRFLLLSSMMIPISLKVTLDLIKLYYAKRVNYDEKLNDPAVGRESKAVSTSLGEDLGMIEYVLSDKTGTLTKNVMVLQKALIGFDINQGITGSRIGEGALVSPSAASKDISKHHACNDQAFWYRAKAEPGAQDIQLGWAFWRALALCNTVIPKIHIPNESPSQPDAYIEFATSSPDEESLVTAAHDVGVTLLTRTRDFVRLQLAGACSLLASQGQTTPTSSSPQTSPTSPTSPTSVSSLTLVSPPAGQVESPVEAGFVISPVVLANHNHQPANIPVAVEDFEIAAILPFTSDRKRMSVLLRKRGPIASNSNSAASMASVQRPTHSFNFSDGRYWLLTKGADEVLIERLRLGRGANDINAVPALSTVAATLDDYARAGLRTLVIAARAFDDSQGVEDWLARFRAAEALVEGRLAALETLSAEIETDLDVIGITGIEDKLQDGVAETILSLREAGIHVWMLTGDKRQTAIEIARTCGLREAVEAYRVNPSPDIRESPHLRASFEDDEKKGALPLDAVRSSPSHSASAFVDAPVNTEIPLFILEQHEGESIDQAVLRVAREVVTMRSNSNAADPAPETVRSLADVERIFGKRNTPGLAQPPFLDHPCYSIPQAVLNAPPTHHSLADEDGSDLTLHPVTYTSTPTNLARPPQVQSTTAPTPPRRCGSPPEFLLVVNGKTINSILQASQTSVPVLAMKETAGVLGYFRVWWMRFWDNFKFLLSSQGVPHPRDAMIQRAPWSEGSAVVHETDMGSAKVVQLVTDDCVLEHSARSAFFALAGAATSVVCCRLTPSQKAAIVDSMKQRGNRTLAIGDGGNDVAMIQAADVGVGIAAREGLQAARAADYSVTEFKSLRDLVLLHGYNAALRTSFIAQYCFYKSMFICAIQLMFLGVSGVSGTSFFDSISLATYNVLYTSLPILFSVIEKDVSADYLLQRPRIYKHIASGVHLNTFTVLSWFLLAVYHGSIVLLFTISPTYVGDRMTNTFLRFGTSSELISSGLTAYSFGVLLQCALVSLLTQSWDLYFNGLVMLITVVGFFIINLIVAAVPYHSLQGIFFVILDSGVFWLELIIVLAICLLPIFLFRVYVDNFAKDPTNTARRHYIREKAQMPSQPAKVRPTWPF